jgi:hypothetical protein
VRERARRRLDWSRRERFGTLAAVEPLLQVSQGAAPAVRPASLAAVRAIQSGLDPADAGRVSVVETLGEQGALSVPAQNGAVSVAPEADQALAPAPATDVRGRG